jgi:hypothetical protein
MILSTLGRRLAAVTIGIGLAVGAQTSVAATSDGPRADALKRMVTKAEAKQWVAARNAARSLRDPVALEAYEWLRLRQPGIDNFGRMTTWVAAHPGWPSGPDHSPHPPW